MMNSFEEVDADEELLEAVSAAVAILIPEISDL